MSISGITWRGESPDDIEMLAGLPQELVALLAEVNGFILHSGVLHVRGASLSPDWHSLRNACCGTEAFHRLYEEVTDLDIPFAQDQTGDQFLIRQGRVYRLEAETASVQPVCDSLSQFLAEVEHDIEGFLNVGLERKLEPGQLWLAFPPFVIDPGPKGVSLKACPASEVIRFHADFARKIRNIPDGGQIEFQVKINSEPCAPADAPMTSQFHFDALRRRAAEHKCSVEYPERKSP